MVKYNPNRWLPKVKLKLPGILVSFLIGAFIFLLFWQDVLQNKFTDLGIDYKVTFFTGTTILATHLYWIVAFAYLIVLLSMIGRNVWEKGHHHKFDWFIGTVALTGFILLLIGAIGGLAYQGNDPLPFFFGVTKINLYHSALVSQIIAAFYFIFTK